ncbi:glutathione S-transferase T3-like [Lactuca sativa]|nr:glutathione S-transferase T3-like [Lactuca sativa]
MKNQRFGLMFLFSNGENEVRVSFSSSILGFTSLILSSQPPLSPDFVPETQPSPPPQTKKKKGKKPARPTTTQERVPWTKEEEEKLAEAWVAASEDPIVRDSQPYGSFWEKVRAIFYELMESETRNADQITSKRRDIWLKCTEFGGIYNNLLNKAAMDQFEKTTPTRKAFPYMKPWLKLKDTPKWKEQTEGTSQSSGSKRLRNPDGTSQQSDDRTHIDINDDPKDLENDQPLRRPVGRNKAKKAVSTSSNSSVMDMFDDKFDRYVQLQEMKAEVMTRMEQNMIEAQTSFQEAQETLQTKTDMEILKMKADDLEGEDLELFQAMKESVRARRRRRG